MSNKYFFFNFPNVHILTKHLVHKLCHPMGGGGVSQKMTLDDMGGGGGPEGPNIG